MSSQDRITYEGDLVRMDGRAIAHCTDAYTAEIVALALSYIGLSNTQIPNRAQRRFEEFFA